MYGSTGSVTPCDHSRSVWNALYLVGGFFSTIAYWVSFKSVFQTMGVDSHGVSREAAFPFFMGFVEYLSKGLLLWIGLADMSRTGSSWWEHAAQALKTCYGGSMLIVPLVSLQAAYQLGEGFSVLYLSASLFAIIRNLRIPCVAMLSSLWFGKEKGHTCTEWALLLSITFGASFAVLAGNHEMTTRTTYVFGVVIALVVVLLSSMKAVLEQGILHAQDLCPLLLAGLQGVLCCAAMAVIMAFVHCFGVEDFRDTVAMIRSSTVLCANVCVFGLICMLDSWLGVMITFRYDSTVKVIVSSSTVFGIWTVQLGIHFFAPVRGEPWLYPKSLVYLMSMVITVTLVILFIKTKQKRMQHTNPKQPIADRA